MFVLGSGFRVRGVVFFFFGGGVKGLGYGPSVHSQEHVLSMHQERSLDMFLIPYLKDHRT